MQKAMSYEYQLMDCGYEFPSSRGFRHFGVQTFLTILCRADSTPPTEGLRKMLLAFEATGYGYIDYSPIGGA